MEKKRVLIIDDDNRNIFALSATLKTRAFECASCLSAEEALTILKNNEHFDAVLIDMMMPDMDGYEAIDKIIFSARSQFQGKLVPTNSVGVKAYMEAIKKKEMAHENKNNILGV